MDWGTGAAEGDIEGEGDTRDAVLGKEEFRSRRDRDRDWQVGGDAKCQHGGGKFHVEPPGADEMKKPTHSHAIEINHAAVDLLANGAVLNSFGWLPHCSEETREALCRSIENRSENAK